MHINHHIAEALASAIGLTIGRTGNDTVLHRDSIEVIVYGFRTSQQRVPVRGTLTGRPTAFIDMTLDPSRPVEELAEIVIRDIITPLEPEADAWAATAYWVAENEHNFAIGRGNFEVLCTPDRSPTSRDLAHLAARLLNGDRK